MSQKQSVLNVKHFNFCLFVMFVVVVSVIYSGRWSVELFF